MSAQTRLQALATAVGAEIKEVRTVDMGGLKLWKGTQSAYNAIGTKDSNTVYFIVG